MKLTLALAAALAILATSACTAPTPPRSAAPSPTPTGPATLPAPTGTHRVGTTALYPKDTSRPDPWNPEVKARRLKVTLWYPTEQRDGERAPYMTTNESELTLKARQITGVPGDTLSRTRTNAIKNAEPTDRKLALVLLSPGFTNPVSTLTSLAEDLASRGYLVAGIDHTYENHATTLPGRQIAECLACDSDTDPGFGTRVVQSRAADVAFVLDHLTSTWEHSDLIDRTRIATVGQSIGGASAIAAMLKDSRIRAGINLDGTLYARIPKNGFTRPVLLMGTKENHTPKSRTDNSWDRDWKLLTGWKRWLVVSGTEHSSFTDSPLLAGALGIRPTHGLLPATRSAKLIRTYVAAFLDQHLKGEPQPVLNQPPPRHPEIALCTTTCR